MLKTLSARLIVLFCIAMPGMAANSQEATSPRIKAIAFDAFPIFDPREIAKAAEEAFPGQGQQLMEIWRTRMFEYQWLRASHWSFCPT